MNKSTVQLITRETYLLSAEQREEILLTLKYNLAFLLYRDEMNSMLHLETTRYSQLTIKTMELVDKLSNSWEVK